MPRAWRRTRNGRGPPAGDQARVPASVRNRRRFGHSTARPFIRHGVFNLGVGATAVAKIIPLSAPHTTAHHKDPSFDRVLLAQALMHDLAVVSPDETFLPYNDLIVWSPWPAPRNPHTLKAWQKLAGRRASTARTTPANRFVPVKAFVRLSKATLAGGPRPPAP